VEFTHHVERLHMDATTSASHHVPGRPRASTSTEDRKGGNEYDRNRNTVVVGNEGPVVLTDYPYSLKS
jgi:hypothetical protein